MRRKKKFSIKDRLTSFKYAFNRLRFLFHEEYNAKIHLGIGLILYVVSSVLKLKKIEIIAIVFSIGFVIVTEIINSAIENLADFIHPEKNERIKKIKNLSAAAVLISTITALCVGLIINFSKLFS